MRNLIPIDLILMLINRQKQHDQFSKQSDGEEIENQQNAIEQNILNQEIFKYLSWLKEEKRMEKLALIRTQGIKQYSTLTQENINGIINQKDMNKNNIIEKVEVKENEYENKNNKINLLDQIKQMMLIIRNIKDKEQAQGATSIIRELILSILFEQTKNWNEINISNTIDDLLQFVNISDDETLINLINNDIFCYLSFIIRRCSQNIKLLLLNEKILRLTTAIAERGSLICRFLEYNHFDVLIDEGGFKGIIQEILQNEINVDKYDKEILKINGRIRMQSAFIFCFMKRYLSNENIENILNICANIFKDKLKSFIHQIQLQSTPDQNQQQNEINMENNNDIDPDELETIQKVLLSLGCLSLVWDNGNPLNVNHKIFELILPLIHCNCTCPKSVTFTDSYSFSNIVSIAFFVLSYLIKYMTVQQINQLNANNDLLNHLISFIISNREYNTQIYTTIPTSSQSQLINHNNILSIHQKSNALHLLISMMAQSKQIKYYILSEQNLIEYIINLIKEKQIHHQTSTESQLTLASCLNVIAEGNLYCQNEQIDNLLHKHNEMEFVTKLMCNAGGIGSDDDYVIVEDLRILNYLLQNANHIHNKRTSQRLENEIKDEIEKEGLLEECNALQFHTYTLEYFGVNDSATELKEQYDKCADGEERNDDDEDDDDEVEERSSSDQEDDDDDDEDLDSNSNSDEEDSDEDEVEDDNL